MKLSTKGRYAVLALVDLAMNSKAADGVIVPVSLFDIAERQELSQQYLEQLFSKLKRHHIVTSVRGQQGGYLLAAPLEAMSITRIIDAVDEPIKSTKCNRTSDFGCQGKQSKCLTHYLWTGLEDHIRTYLDGISLAQVIEQETSKMKKESMRHAS
jgi:Rrf2 family iron-sulfur cluster assembly transcriptional regulator